MLLCAAALPVFVLILVYAFFGVSISQFRPSTNDEVAYWHQALTFSQVGFRGGYYTIDEVTNPSGLTPFGPHGPGFPVLFGLFGAVFGWYRHSVVLVNLIAIGGAVCIWGLLTELSLRRLWLSAVMLATLWHIVFWAPTGMQESFHHAAAIVLAACFASVLGPSPRRLAVVLGWIVIGLASFIRPSWIILLPLWATATTRRARWPIMAAAVGASLLYGALVLLAYSSTTAPYGTGFFFLRAASLSSPVQALFDNAVDNLQRIVRPGQFRTIELLQRFQYGVFLLATCVAVLWAHRRQRQSLTLHLPVTAVALAAALAAMLLLYEFASYAEHRILSAFLLFGALLCVAAPGRLGPLLVAGLVLSNVMTVRVALSEFEDSWNDRFDLERADLSEMEQAIEGTIVYRPGASRWCNTLLTSQYPTSLIVVPGGIGLSVIMRGALPRFPPRSHYLLLDEVMRAEFPVPLNLDVIATFPYGTLYVNRDAECP